MGERMKSVGRNAVAGDEVAKGQLVAGAVRTETVLETVGLAKKHEGGTAKGWLAMEL